MTRTELVKKLTALAAVEESYAASFMEAFLLYLHRQLQQFDSFKLPNQISFSQKKVSRNNKELFLINCASSGSVDSASEELVFAVPTPYNEPKQDKYSVFSIGIGKQVIPNKEMIASGFAFEPSFSLKNYCREKVETLLQKGEFVSAKTASSNFAWDFSQSVPETNFSADESLHDEIVKEVQEFAWDFGNNWKRELQEDEILSVKSSPEDVVKQTIDEKNDEEFSGWNFSEDDSEPSSSSQQNSASQTKIEEVDFSKLHEKIQPSSTGFEYEEVKAKDKTQELSIDLSEFEKIFEREVPEEQEHNASEEDEAYRESALDDDYVHVQSTSEFVLTQEQEKLLSETDPFSNFTVEKTEPEIEEDATSAGSWEESVPSFSSEPNEDKEYPDAEAIEQAEPAVKKEKGNKFWTLVSVALLISIFCVLYWKMWGIPAWFQTNSKTTQQAGSKPSIIEREYDLPVTFPYEVKVNESPKTETANNNKKPLNSSVNLTQEKPPEVKNEFEASDIFSKKNPGNRIAGKTTQAQEKLPPQKAQPVVKKEITPKTEAVKVSPKKTEIIKEKLPETKKTALVRDNIYLEGSNYVVQLSSWKSETIADQEVVRLKRKGIKAFKTSAVIPQKGGTWYRVKVGGFSSAEEASRFFNSIK